MKRKIFLLSLVAAVLTLAIAGCQREGCTDPKATNYDSDAKKDNGTCVYADPEPQPTEPTKVITMDWNWETALWEDLNRDTIAYYAAQPDVKTIILFADKDAPVEHPENHGCSTTSGGLSSGFPTRVFHTVRDSLQTRFDISPKVVGSGTIIVSSQGGGSTVRPNRIQWWYELGRQHLVCIQGVHYQTQWGSKIIFFVGVGSSL